MKCDAVIFGGGVAGLWLLDELLRKGCSAVLLESRALGSGQTVASQGIIHGGLKYTLQGMLTRSAANISEMPGLWRACLTGVRAPDLRQTRVRSESCYLWRTESLGSRIGMIGARFGLTVAPQALNELERPTLLKDCPGTVALLEEQVISPQSLIENLQNLNFHQILHYDPEQGLELETTERGEIARIVISSANRCDLILEPEHVVLAAGAGNGLLRTRCGLASPKMQLRPLHMLMLRGNLPGLNGHCVDGAKTRVTITTDRDSLGRTVWQVGGQIAELGVSLSRPELIELGERELEAVIPGIDLTQAEWGSYRVDRAERVMHGGKRPESFQIVREGNISTVWPTKLVLAPVLAERIAASIVPRYIVDSDDWLEQPRPRVALPPWEFPENWQVAALRRTA
ncbi:MAG TPA: FAD-dependent oxidoreductase [Planctomycetaceae bacterium]|nr:FAD-dependent oxidoreductase [Planctomycetaceae bacterium]